MYTLLLIICCTGFFCLYNTSQKAKLASAGFIERWLQSNLRISRLLGIGSIVTCLVGLIFMDGGVMGTIDGMLMLMAAGCYITGLAPLRLFRIQHLLILGVFAFILELLIF